jgi:hypothetical protein
MGGDLGGGKKGREPGKEGGKNHPLPQSGLLLGDQAGEFEKKLPKGEEKNSHSPFCLGGQMSSLAATPTGPQGAGLCLRRGPVF